MKEEFKGIKVISPNVKKLSILEELAITSRINAQSVLSNNETISRIVSELNRIDTHINVTNSNFNSNNSTEPIISIKTDLFPNNEAVLLKEEDEDMPQWFDEDPEDTE